MLKIKDNVDLKELEKYGLILKYECDRNTGEVWVDKICQYQDNNPVKGLYIICFYTENRKDLILGAISTKGSYILYDLIKDGLVEKVEE